MPPRRSKKEVEEESYEVEAVVDRRRTKKNEVEYLLKWKGYAEPTWTPAKDCDSCSVLINDYKRKFLPPNGNHSPIPSDDDDDDDEEESAPSTSKQAAKRAPRKSAASSRTSTPSVRGGKQAKKPPASSGRSSRTSTPSVRGGKQAKKQPASSGRKRPMKDDTESSDGEGGGDGIAKTTPKAQTSSAAKRGRKPAKRPADESSSVASSEVAETSRRGEDASASRSGRAANRSAGKRPARDSTESSGEEGGGDVAKTTPKAQTSSAAKRGRKPVNRRVEESSETGSEVVARRDEGGSTKKAANRSTVKRLARDETESSDEEEEDDVAKTTPKAQSSSSSKRGRKPAKRPAKESSSEVIGEVVEEVVEAVARRTKKAAKRSTGDAQKEIKEELDSQNPLTRRLEDSNDDDDEEEEATKREKKGRKQSSVKRRRKADANLQSSADASPVMPETPTGRKVKKMDPAFFRSVKDVVEPREEEGSASRAGRAASRKLSSAGVAAMIRGRPRRSEVVTPPSLELLLADVIACKPYVIDYYATDEARIEEQYATAPVKFFKPEDFPGISVWTEQAYTGVGHVIPPKKQEGGGGEEQPEQPEMFRGREVVRIVGYVKAAISTAKDQYVLVLLSLKDSERTLQVLDAVQAVSLRLAGKIFPKACEVFEKKVKANSARAGPSTSGTGGSGAGSSTSASGAGSSTSAAGSRTSASGAGPSTSAARARTPEPSPPETGASTPDITDRAGPSSSRAVASTSNSTVARFVL